MIEPRRLGTVACDFNIMRVLVILCIAGGVLANPTVMLPSVPVSTSYNVEEPRAGFEYSSSVETSDYANSASVRSDNAELVTSYVPHVLKDAAPAIRTIEHSSASHLHSPSVPVVAISSAAPNIYSYDHSAAIVAPQTYAAQYIQPVLVEKPSKAFEYSSSVQTADYANYASVKSDSAGFIATPVAQINFGPVAQTGNLFSVASPLQSVRQSASAYFTPAAPHLAQTNYASQFTYQPRDGFEYSSSVRTADYSNYASVKSDSQGLVSSPVTNILGVAAPSAVLKASPVVQSKPYSAPASLVSVQSAAPIYSHAPAIVAPQPYAAQRGEEHIVQVAPAQFETLVHDRVAPEPAIFVEQQPTITVHAAAPIVKTVVDQVILNDKSQYHSQDSLGQAAYGHSEALQTHNAIQDAAGNKAGSYSYVAPDGRVLTTDYIADEYGYRVATNALPVHTH